MLAHQINKLGLENRCLNDSIIKYTLNNTFQTNLLSNRRAPLASISSLKMSSIDYQDSSLRSPISDSMFEASYADTDDDMDQFSTDSDVAAIIDMHNQPEPTTMPQKKRKFDTKTIACIERTSDYEVAAGGTAAGASTGCISNSSSSSSSSNMKPPQLQAQHGIHNDQFDTETICEISEIGPQALTFPVRYTADELNSAHSSTHGIHSAGDVSGGGGGGIGIGGNSNTNKYRKSTGSMAVQESAQKCDKNQYFSEPSGLNLHTVTVAEPSPSSSPPKKAVSSKPSGNVLRMPSKTSYSSSSSRSNSSSYTTT